MDEQVKSLILVNLGILIPVGILLVMLLYKLVMLLQSLGEFLTLAQYEVSPTLKDVRSITRNVETISQKAVSGVESVERGVEATKPVVSQSVENVRSLSSDLKNNVSAVVSGIFRSFSK